MICTNHKLKCSKRGNQELKLLITFSSCNNLSQSKVKAKVSWHLLKYSESTHLVCVASFCFGLHAHTWLGSAKAALGSACCALKKYWDEELRFMYKNSQGHLTVFCIVFVWLRGPPSPVRIMTQVPWFMYQNRLGPSGGIYYPIFVPCFVVLYLNNELFHLSFTPLPGISG